MLKDLVSANIEIFDNTGLGYPDYLRINSDKMAGNTKWKDSGLKAGDQIRIIAGSEEATFTLDSTYFGYMTGSSSMSAMFTNMSMIPNFTFSSTASNFDAQVIDGANMIVKLKNQEGNESAGLIIVAK